MAGRLEVPPGRFLEWRLEQTLRPQRIESSVFYFLDAEWRLVIDYKDEEYCVILKKVTPWNDFHPFEVATWLEDEGRTLSTLNYRRGVVRSAYQSIWAMDEEGLREEMSKCEGNVQFTFVYLLRVREEKNQSIRASLEFHADFEGLSADLGNLLEEGLMPDVMVKCGNRTFPAHRAILASRSEGLSSHSFGAKPKMEPFPMPYDPEVVELLLKYVYCGRLSNVRSIELVQALYRAAGEYVILGLEKACSDYLRQVLNEEKCISSLELAQAHSDEHLNPLVIDFAVGN